MLFVPYDIMMLILNFLFINLLVDNLNYYTLILRNFLKLNFLIISVGQKKMYSGKVK